MVSVDIIRAARKQLKDFIAFEGQILYVKIHGHNPDFSKDEEFVIEADDFIEDIAIELEDGTHFVKRVKIALDGNVFLDVMDDDSWEYNWDDLTTDCLYRLAFAIEERYKRN